MGNETAGPFILLEALPRSVSVRVLFRSSGVLGFVLPRSVARVRPNGGTSMAEQ